MEIEVEAGESGDCGAENPLMAFTWGALWSAKKAYFTRFLLHINAKSI